MSGDTASAAGAGSQNWAFALVHGIGTTQPIPLIEEVTAALQTVRPGLVLDGPIEAYKVPATRGLLDDDADRRQYVQNARLPGGTARFAATHWSDISFYKDGLVNMIGGLMLTSFGVRFFAQCASANDVFLGRVLDLLLRTMVWIIAIVVFPFTFVSLIYSLMGLLAENLFQFDRVHWQSTFVVIASLALVVATFLLGRWRSIPMQHERPLAMPIFRAMLVYGVLIALLIVAGHLKGASFSDLGWYVSSSPGNPIPHIMPHRDGPVATMLASLMQHSGWMFGHRWWILRVESLDGLGIYFGFMHWMQTLAGIVLIVLAVSSLICLGFHVLFRRIKRGGEQSLVFATVAVISIWIMNLVVLWPENLITASAMSTYSTSKRIVTDNKGPAWCISPQSEWRRQACDGFSKLAVFNWNLKQFEERTYIIAEPSKEQLASGSQEFQRDLNGQYPVMWFEGAFILFMMLMAVTAVFLVVARWIWRRWARRCRLSEFRIAVGGAKPRWSNWPRLIIADIYMVSVVGLTAIVGLILLAHISPRLEEFLVYRLVLGATPNIKALPHELPIPFGYMKLLVILFVVLSALGATYIRDITKLMLDVVNHFVVGPRGSANTYPVRKRIEDRFHQTIDFLLAEGDKPHLVVIAHSQGTVITFDALRDGLWDKVKDRAQSLTILTFGSPLTHVYQQYFSRLYPILASNKSLRDLRHEGRFLWINSYRIDDYVGTYIENSIPHCPINVALPPGGHTAYWRADAFKLLFEEPEMRAVLPTAIAAPVSSPAYAGVERVLAAG